MLGSIIIELLLVLLVFICLSALLQFHWKRRRLYRMAAKIPGPKNFPLIGSAHLFAGSTFSNNIYSLFKIVVVPKIMGFRYFRICL